MRPCTAHELVENCVQKHEILQAFPSQQPLEQSQLTAQGTELRRAHLVAYQAAASVAAPQQCLGATQQVLGESKSSFKIDLICVCVLASF